MRRFLPFLLLILAGCANPFYVTPQPPAPPTPPVVVDPVPGAIPYTLVEMILPAMTRAEVVGILGEPAAEYPHEDGTVDLTWPAVDSHGAARRLEVRLSEDAVISRVLF